jgi:translation elongation factor EF-G
VRDHLNIKLSTEVRNIRFTKPIVMENVFDGKKVDMEKLKKKLKNFQKRSTSVQPKVNEE